MDILQPMNPKKFEEDSMSDQTYSPVPEAGDSSFVLRQGVKTDLKTMSQWMKFMAIMMFVFGGIYALTLVGIIVAWFPILVGYWLYKGANKINIFVANDQNALDDAVKMLKYYFMACGISMIISIVFMVIYIIIMVALVVLGVATGGSNPFSGLF
jgi:hypothetical protein